MSSKITYENKGALKNDLDVPDKNKVTEDDMNEIKNVVNANADELDTAKENIGDLQSGQGTASADITNLKNKVATLESDNTTNKSNISNLQSNKVDKIEGKGLSTNDFTNEYKEKLDDLENYDDTEVKKDISDIKEEQVEQNTNTDLVADMIPTLESEEAENINVDSSKYYGQVKVRGKSEQETIPSTEHPSEIKNLSGDIEITVCNKNLFDEDFSQGYDSNGNIVTSSQFVCNTNLIDVIENESYTISNNLNLKIASVAYYKDNKFISFQSNMNLATITIPQNVNQIRFNLYKEPTLSVSDFTFCQFEKKGTATDYIEHEEQKIIFPLSQGQKMYYGDYLADDGIHHVRKQIELDGTESWNILNWSTPHTKTTIFYSEALIAKRNNSIRLCNYFKRVENTAENLDKDEEYCLSAVTGAIYICISNEIATTGEQLNTWLAQKKQEGKPLIAEYTLIEEEIDPYTEAQQEAYDKLNEIMTYYPVTNVYSNQGAKLQLIYKMNLNSMFATVQNNVTTENNEQEEQTWN